MWLHELFPGVQVYLYAGATVPVTIVSVDRQGIAWQSSDGYVDYQPFSDVITPEGYAKGLRRVI